MSLSPFINSGLNPGISSMINPNVELVQLNHVNIVSMNSLQNLRAITPVVAGNGVPQVFLMELNSTCSGPGEGCCPAPQGDVKNCPASARTKNCDAKKSCCCG